MVTGSPPFAGPTPRAVIARRFAGPPAPVSGLRADAPAALVAAVARALLRDPGDRFQSAREFRRALEAVRYTDLSGEPAPLRLPRRDMRHWRSLRRGVPPT